MPQIISGPNALVLMLHEEMRSWRQRGVSFTLANDGTINILTESREAQREAQAYRSRNSEALRRYLAFVDGRDPDDAIRHLEFAWELRDKKVAAMDLDIQEQKPRVRGMMRELSHEEERLTDLDRERDECRERIAHLKQEIVKETGPYQGEPG